METRQTAQTPDPPPLLGAGFQITRWEAGRLAVYEADENATGGRPFLDAVEIQLGRPLREQAGDLDLGKADVVELGPERAAATCRRGGGRGRRRRCGCWRWYFRRGSTTRACARRWPWRWTGRRFTRCCCSGRARCRARCCRNGSSGYAFLFPVAADLGRARQLAAGARPLTLGVADPAARPIAERIAVNARDAGLAVSVTGQTESADVTLVELRIDIVGPGEGAGRAGGGARAAGAGAHGHGGAVVHRGAGAAGGVPRDSAGALAGRVWRGSARAGRTGDRAVGRMALRERLVGAAMRRRPAPTTPVGQAGSLRRVGNPPYAPSNHRRRSPAASWGGQSCPQPAFVPAIRAELGPGNPLQWGPHEFPDPADADLRGRHGSRGGAWWICWCWGARGRRSSAPRRSAPTRWCCNSARNSTGAAASWCAPSTPLPRRTPCAISPCSPTTRSTSTTRRRWPRPTICKCWNWWRPTAPS